MKFPIAQSKAKSMPPPQVKRQLEEDGTDNTDGSDRKEGSPGIAPMKLLATQPKAKGMTPQQVKRQQGADGTEKTGNPDRKKGSPEHSGNGDQQAEETPIEKGKSPLADGQQKIPGQEEMP